MGIYRRKDSDIWWMKKTICGITQSVSTGEKNKTAARYRFEEWATELKRRHEKGEQVNAAVKQAPKERTTFRELSERYLEFIKGRLKSARNIAYTVKFLVLTFNEKPLDSFKLADVEKLQNDAISRGLSVRTANSFVNITLTMLNKACEWELIDEQVIKAVKKCKKLKGENKRLRYLNMEESKRLISFCDSHIKPIVITALNTGMRRGEILGLTWDRIDFENGVILLDKTKNGERREIPINNTLRKTLSGIVRNIKTDYVFYNPLTLKKYGDLKKSWHTALRKAHILDFHFHDLRHTFASWLVMKGVDLFTVQKLLGHKSITMTLRYAHLAKGHLKEAVNVLDNVTFSLRSEKVEKI